MTEQLAKHLVRARTKRLQKKYGAAEGQRIVECESDILEAQATIAERRDEIDAIKGGHWVQEELPAVSTPPATKQPEPEPKVVSVVRRARDGSETKLA